MLLRLSIQDIVLIDKLSLDFGKGFLVFTGETGAGKSIILDSLMFALGARTNANFVRMGAETGQVVANFDVSNLSIITTMLNENGLDAEDILIVKRLQTKDGRSRAFINDQPVSLALLRNIGRHLVELHGQHAERAFLELSAHLRSLDDFADVSSEYCILEDFYRQWQALEVRLTEQEEALERAKREQDYLQAAATELATLNITMGEEQELSSRRATLMRYEKMATDITHANELLIDNNSPVQRIADLLRLLERKRDQMPEQLDPIIQHLDAALNALSFAQDTIEQTMRSIDFNPKELELLEERLFALRAASRKYKISVDELPNLYEQIEAQLALIEKQEADKIELLGAIELAKNEYHKFAHAISQKRYLAAKDLEQRLSQELRGLKLEHAQFIVKLETDTNKATAKGIDEVEFWVKTNPTTAPGPLMKIASGGELARFLLALKMVLTNKTSIPTLVFDEVDAGVGGAVAAAIGERLLQLSRRMQILSITHSPQVAAKASEHFLITKEKVVGGDSLVTKVQALQEEEAIEELARMLSAREVTPQARATAKILRAAG
ncbi:DNA repair protein RecN [Bartonella sp. TP]|uniref:DNA repair protein RecN n=1 Tax=Bartonella sp. TP TaxID=3057550 RepID=UPI0025B2550F|nr:DNA repair protein RecN [Bartonella sp. TP]WJW79772.1 DNA repair protein RecN [Bartonella sp. TP]